MPKPQKICATCGSDYEQDALFCPKDGTPLGNSRTVPGEDPYVGLVLGEQIELRQLIGIGSMGRVYRAFQRGVERDVAVKMLHRELSANPTLVSRFLREARIASRLSHPNVVQVVMAGQLPQQVGSAPIGGELYIVMEFLDGISLMSAVAASDGAMPLPRALHVALQICDAVGEAHAQNIVHRDLKPENVMLVRRGDDPDFVKVLDFGIARLDWGDESFATQAGLIFGTARYISPEGSQGEPVAPPADVYAIATILYQCLSGQTPFDADSPMALLMQHSYEKPPPLLGIPRASYVPPPIAAAVMHNLAKSPSDRSPDARSFGRELVEAARAGGLSPDDLVPRSTLLGQRAAHASFTSIQRTKQMQLSAETAAVIGAHGAQPAAQTPQPEAQSVLQTPQPEAQSVEATPPPLATSSPTPSQPAIETEHGAALSLRTVPGAPSVPPDSGVVRTPMPSSVSGPIEPTLDDDDESVLPRRARARLAVFVFVCFLGGAMLASTAAYQLGYLGGGTSQGSAAERANRALQNRQWNQPPGDNVKDITDEGLAKNPNDSALRDVRRRAADELVNAALGRKYAGDVKGALAFAKLAHELSPGNTTAQHLVRELEQLSDAGPPVVATPDVVDATIDAPPTSTTRTVKPPPKPTAFVPPAASSIANPGTAQPPAPSSTGSASVPAPSSTSGRWL
jgi:eukaryotic-like serine/threonine-protein kinase